MPRAWPGLAATAGGIAWSAKAVAIMITGVQPPLVFEAGPIFFALAVFGLSPRRARLARALAALAFAASLLAPILQAAGPASWTPAEDDLTPVGASILVGTLALLASLVALARARAPAWPPIALAVGLLAAGLLGAGLALLHERLFELPILLIGAGWVAFGAAALRSR